ncbi:MAG TPA: hypothetical protein VF644_02945 [Pyrinomonadaceae bacterium]|jgi:hypothetical protein
MPTDVIFSYTTIHRVQKNGGLVFYVPALPHASRLYVIRHTLANNFPFYIGTANNINHRFEERLRAVREFGFRNNEINNISIAIVQITVGGVPRPPHNNGISAGIDVENLLIRSYMQQGHGVRNIAKVAPFLNNSGQTIRCYFYNTANWAHFVPANHNVPNNTFY